jgi:hypothetical protein
MSEDLELEDWQEPIACMWRFVRNDGITEGFHSKMKLIQCRAYGFRNFGSSSKIGDMRHRCHHVPYVS